MPGIAAGIRHPPTVQTRATQDATPHHPTLLHLQDHLGLGDPYPHLLHSHHGTLQCLLQDQAEQRHLVGGGQHRGCHLPGRHCAEFPHDVCRTSRGGDIRPETYPHELCEDLVCYRPAFLLTLRCHQCF